MKFNAKDFLRLDEAFETHEQLNQKLFNGIDIKTDVRDRLKEIGDLFVQSIIDDNIPIKVYDYWFLGSNAAYNYNKYSDIDLHIIVDIADSSNPQLLELLYNYIKSDFNKKYDIKIKGQEVEVYLEDINSSAISNGIYSILQNKWIKFPEKQAAISIDITTSPLYNQYAQRYHDIDLKDAETLLDDLYILRKISLATEGEFGEGNLIFKQFRNEGWLDALKDMKYAYRSKELTLEGIRK